MLFRSEELKLRSDLLRRLQEELAAVKQPQHLVAARLGVSQPRVSDLRRGKLHLFSLESLINMLRKLGVEVSVTVPERSEESKALGDLLNAGVIADLGPEWVTSESVIVIAESVAKVTDAVRALALGWSTSLESMIVTAERTTKSGVTTACNTQLSLAA